MGAVSATSAGKVRAAMSLLQNWNAITVSVDPNAWRARRTLIRAPAPRRVTQTWTAADMDGET